MKKLLSIAIALIMMIACIPVSAAFAEGEGGSSIDITIDGKEYKNVTTGSELIIGNVDPEKADIVIVSVDGNKLNNVGTKSGVLDSQGRIVLEANFNKGGEGYWTVRFNYHAGDDPDVSNQKYPFEIVNIIFKKSESSSIDTVKAAAVTSLKAAPLKKAAKITWKSSKCTGYEVQYSTSSAFKNAKTKKVTSKYCTIKNLKSGKKYYVRVRSYIKYEDALGNIKTVKSGWKKVSCKVK